MSVSAFCENAEGIYHRVLQLGQQFVAELCFHRCMISSHQVASIYPYGIHIKYINNLIIQEMAGLSL